MIYCMNKIWMPRWLAEIEKRHNTIDNKKLHLDSDTIIEAAISSHKNSEPSSEIIIKSAQNEVAQLIDVVIDAALVLEGSILDDKGEVKSLWTGSAFLIQPNIAISNSHTVLLPNTEKGEKAVYVVSLDGETFHDINVLAIDENIDISVFEIEGILSDTYLPLGDSDQVQVGEMIVILGAPEGWSNTATVGYITNKGQTIEEAGEPWSDLLFTDAYVSTGSSGGAAVNMEGAVIGVVVGIVGKHSDVGVGINALIPVNKVKKFLAQHHIPYEEA